MIKLTLGDRNGTENNQIIYLRILFINLKIQKLKNIPTKCPINSSKPII